MPRRAVAFDLAGPVALTIAVALSFAPFAIRLRAAGTSVTITSALRFARS
ncbi:MAG: hypothetical protein QOC77_3159, partial [Thermoleophilaceae bacterium]|nr:hypothetical protein [Thermoleophilaceae bacterium]